MSISMYDASVPVFKHMLGSLSTIVRKAAEHAANKKIDPAALMNARLFPDMFALARQVQIASDLAKGGAARLAGVEIPKFEDDETSFDQLLARIAKTIAFLDSIAARQFEGSEQREIVLQLHETQMEFNGRDYLLNWVLPNFYFHVTTTYNLLRHNGVELGKRDFLGG